MNCNRRRRINRELRDRNPSQKHAFMKPCGRQSSFTSTSNSACSALRDRLGTVASAYNLLAPTAIGIILSFSRLPVHVGLLCRKLDSATPGSGLCLTRWKGVAPLLPTSIFHGLSSNMQADLVLVATILSFITSVFGNIGAKLPRVESGEKAERDHTQKAKTVIEQDNRGSDNATLQPWD